MIEKDRVRSCHDKGIAAARIGAEVVLDEIARTGVAGNQDFTFIGASAFSNAKGELRTVNGGTGAKVVGDVNADGTPDFSILVQGAHNLHAADFVL